VLALAIVVFAALQYVPVAFDAWQFHDQVRQEVKFAATSQRTVDSIREAILEHAEELAIPLEPKEVRVESDGPFFIVHIRYTVPIDLRVLEHELPFEWELTGETFQ
jgi:hypothetical protein